MGDLLGLRIAMPGNPVVDSRVAPSIDSSRRMHFAAHQFLGWLTALALFCNSVACICRNALHATTQPVERVAHHPAHPGCHGHATTGHDEPAGHRDSQPDGKSKCEHCQGALGKASDPSAKVNLDLKLSAAALVLTAVAPTSEPHLRSFTPYAASAPPIPADTSLLRLHCALNT
jgi:hypothetical protein